MARALTDALLRGTKPPAKGRLEFADTRCIGLTYRLTAGGVASFSFRFRNPEPGEGGKVGEPARCTIGGYPSVSLAQARERADELRRIVAAGVNPNSKRKREKDAAPGRTFAAVAARYLAEHAERRKRPRSVAEDKRNLKLHILPRWRSRSIGAIRRGDVIELVEALIKDGKPVLANRVQSLVSKIFSFAVDADLIDANPCTRLEKRGTETARRRVLTDGEIKIFWERIIAAPVSPGSGLALRHVLLIGARPGEVAGLAAGEVEFIDDRTRAAWTVPQERSKNKQPHYLPLPARAVANVRAAFELAGNPNGPAFPSPRGKAKSIGGHALAKAMARFAAELRGDDPAVKSWKANPPTPHDLRRTVGTRLSALGISKEDRDAVLNHKRRDVGRVYDLYDRAKEKRRALASWDAALGAILNGTAAGVVVPIGQARKGRRR